MMGMRDPRRTDSAAACSRLEGAPGAGLGAPGWQVGGASRSGMAGSSEVGGGVKTDGAASHR